MISDAYREQNAALHRAVPAYGVGGAKWASLVRSVSDPEDTILDYGCGKGALAKALSPRSVMEYDPAIPEKDINGRDLAADTIVCTDVLEHIEPDELDAVIKNIYDLTRKRLLVCIATVPAKKKLPDGRNAHLSVWPASWWKQKLSPWFHFESWDVQKNSAVGIAVPVRELGQITSIAAMDDARRNENVRRNCAAVSKRVKDGITPHDLTASLVCFGPSLQQTWPELRGREDVYCVGAAHQFLIERDIIPYAMIDCDPRARNAMQMGTPHKAVRYWLASCVDPSYVRKLEGFDLSLFHLHNGQVSADFVWELEPEAWMLVGGGSVGLRSISLLYARGYRKFDIYGMDSSYANGAVGGIQYAGPHSDQNPKRLLEVRCGDRWFKTNPSLVDYARQFFDDLRLWPDATFRFFGDGLLQEMSKHA